MTATPFSEPRAKRRPHRTALAALLFGAAMALPAGVSAQDAALVPGDGVVTRFSGFSDREHRHLDQKGVVARVMEIETGGAAPAEPQELAALTAEDVGQVFAVEIAGAQAPAIYLAASSAYGLYRSEDGSDWAPGMWGPEGGPGTIWKVDPGADPEIFATIGGKDQENRGAALGDLAYDEVHDRLIVSDLSSGMIQSLDPKTGEVLQTFDHGVDGRSYFLDAQTSEYLVLDVLPVDTRNRPDFDDCRNSGGQVVPFASEPACWGLTDFRRRVWGLGVSEAGDETRLYYAVWGGAALGSDGWRAGTDDARTSIWSVRLDQNGNFDLTDVRREIVLPASGGQDAAAGSGPVVDIAFPDASTMVLAERGRPAPDLEGDPARLVDPQAARVLVLSRSDEGTWSVEGRYDAGASAGANASGGVALGARGGPTGDGAPIAPGGRIWMTVDPLCTADTPCEGIDAEGTVAGLQARSLSRISELDPAGSTGGAPAAAGLVVLSRGLPVGSLGQVAIYRGPDVELTAPDEPAPEMQAPPAAGEPEIAERPAEPQPEPASEEQAAPEPEIETVAEVVLGRSGSDLAVAASAGETCKPGSDCTVEITVANDGTTAYAGPLVLTGTPGGSGVSFVGAEGGGWKCTSSGGVAVCRQPEASLAPQDETKFRVTLRPEPGYDSPRLEYCAAVTWLGRDGRDRTRAVQAALREKGFEPGAVDGAMGPKTAAAITQAQQAAGLTADGSLSGALIVELFGEGAFLEGDAGAENDRACAVAQVDLPPRPKAPPQPSHAAEISAFHRDYESRYHDRNTSTPVERHDPALSRFHQTYGSNLHDTRTSRPEIERRDERQGGSFHDSSSSRFQAPDGGQGRMRVHEAGTSRTLDLHEERMSRFHQSFTSEAHDGRTSRPVPLHDPAVTRFHQTAPSSVHDGRTSRGRFLDRDGPGNPPLQHDRQTSRVRPAY